MFAAYPRRRLTSSVPKKGVYGPETTTMAPIPASSGRGSTIAFSRADPLVASRRGRPPPAAWVASCRADSALSPWSARISPLASTMPIPSAPTRRSPQSAARFASVGRSGLNSTSSCTASRSWSSSDCRQSRRRDRHAERQRADAQPAAEGYETVPEEEEGVARRHQEHQGDIAHQRSEAVLGAGVELAQDAGQSEGAQREGQVPEVALSTPQPVDDGGRTEHQEAEADDRLHDLQRPGHRHNFTASNSGKATQQHRYPSSIRRYQLFPHRLGFSRPV